MVRKKDYREERFAKELFAQNSTKTTTWRVYRREDSCNQTIKEKKNIKEITATDYYYY